VCKKSWDVFDVAGAFHPELDKFPKKINHVKALLGIPLKKPSAPALKKFVDTDKLPFTILGVADDQRIYFIGRWNRLISIPMNAITKPNLLTIASLGWWRDNFSPEDNVSWDTAADYIITVAGGKDFDLSKIRGRGAWREKDGRICYHDGAETIGKKSDARLYLRLSPRPLGLELEPADVETSLEISRTVNEMSFKTHADCVRLMGWTALAPFCGALPWRPALLITGPSGSGKTSVLTHVVYPLAKPESFSGGGTTEAAIRQLIKNDASPIVIEESETDTPKKKSWREDLFSLMRQSTSDDAPKIAKGTKDGAGTWFEMRSMFLFAAISPEIESVADDNRIFRIEMIEPKNDWKALRIRLNELITDDNCARIRALTWQKLPEILELADVIAPIIQDETGKDIRYSYADAILLAAFELVWHRQTNLDKENIPPIIRYMYTCSPADKKRDETVEIVERLLDEVVDFDCNDRRKRLPLRQILKAINTRRIEGEEEDDDEGSGDSYGYTILEGRELTEFRRGAGMHGMAVLKDGSLAIASSHHAIMKIIQKGAGYSKILKRHPGLVDGGKRVGMAGTTKVCVVIKGVL
jgi:hypothetical protein